jgi:tetratricopeptide (TPR) repeat protein
VSAATSALSDGSLAEFLAACTVHLDVPGGGGTGFFVAPGWALTCAHVVAGRQGDEVLVRGQAGEATGRVVAQRPDRPPTDDGPYPFPDLALVQVDGWAGGQPCAWLGQDIPALDGRLHTRGYTGTWDRDHPSAEPALFTYEGLHDVDGGGLLKLAAGEAVLGMSGGPLLDLASGQVCGVVKTTRDARAPRGGWAVPARVVREFYPELWAMHDRFHHDDRRWREVAERWRELAGLLLEPPLPRPKRISASYLLGAEFEVVAFRGREELLGQLERWCQEPGELGVRLITGPGGQGKSRLARQLCAHMTSRGWLAGLAQAKLSDAALERLRTTSIPCLLIIDYAEGQGDQVARLVDTLLGVERAGPVRLLLLARAAGDWWADLHTSTRRLEHALEDTVELELLPLEDTQEGRRRAYEDAVAAFAKQIDRHPPNALLAQLPDLRDGSVLQLHMAALAALLPATQRGIGSRERLGNPTERLLNHERRYWRQAASAAKLDYDGVELSRAVAAATLCGADDEAQAVSLLKRVPGLPSGRQSARLGRVVHQLYPSRNSYWGALQPDLLGEELIAQVMVDPVVPGGTAGFLAALLTDASEQQLHRALTVLARAAPRHAHLRDALGPLLRANPHRLMLPAVAVTTQARDPGPLVSALRQALDVLAGSPFVVAVAEQLPEHSVALADLAVDATRQALEYYRAQAGSESAEVARQLNNLSTRLSAIGERQEALDAVVEAVRYLRQLAKADPDAFLPDLAMALNNLSASLADAGKRQDALDAVVEAVRYLRQLAKADPDAFLPDLAMALNNLSIRLTAVGKRTEALSVVEQALAIRRRLAEAAPDAFLPGLAMTLHNLSNQLTAVGQWREALRAVEEAVGHYRRLAETAPDAFLPGLAMALNNLSACLAGVGREPEALGPVEEAVGYYRQLAKVGPDMVLPDLASARSGLSIEFTAAGQRKEASRAVTEAVRQLAKIDPDTFSGLPTAGSRLPLLLTFRFTRIDRPHYAMRTVEEDPSFRQRLIKDPPRPDVLKDFPPPLVLLETEPIPNPFLPHLAMALNNLSIRLTTVGRRGDALRAVEEAVSYYRELAETAPDAFLPDLAMALYILSNELNAAGRRREALRAVEEAVSYHRRLAEGVPDAFPPRYGPE